MNEVESSSHLLLLVKPALLHSFPIQGKYFPTTSPRAKRLLVMNRHSFSILLTILPSIYIISSYYNTHLFVKLKSIKIYRLSSFQI